MAVEPVTSQKRMVTVLRCKRSHRATLLHGQAGSGRGETLRDDRVGGLDARRMTCHRGDELVALERVQVDVLDSRDRRCSRHVAEERDLAEVVAGTELPHRRSIHRDLELTGIDDEEAVAGLSLAYDGIARPHANPDELTREPFDLSLRERGEDRDLAQKGELPDSGARTPCRSPPRRFQKSRPSAGRKAAGRNQRAPDADPVDERRREDGTDSHRADDQALDRAEDSPEHFIRNGTLEQRRRGDLDEGVSDADECDQDERADAELGKIPIRIKGMPQSSVPIAKSEASFWRATRATVTAAPTSPPMPNAEFR